LDVLVLARDPSIRDHRRAVVAAEEARRALVTEARAQRDRGEFHRAFEAVRAVLRDGEDQEARSLEAELREGLGRIRQREAGVAEEIRRARQLAAGGNPEAALRELALLEGTHESAGLAAAEIRDNAARVDDLRSDAERLLRSKDLAGAWEAMHRCQSFEPRGPRIRALHAKLLKAVARSGDGTTLAALLLEGRELDDPSDSELQSARSVAVRGLLARVEKALKDGEVDQAAAWLETWPLGTDADRQASRWSKGLKLLSRARRLEAEGDPRVARELAEEARALLPAMGAIATLIGSTVKREKEAEPSLQAARAALSQGRLRQAKVALLGLLERQPRHREAVDLLATLDVQDAEDQEVLSQVRRALLAGAHAHLVDGRRQLLGLEARRPDLDEVPVLLRDVDRRLKESSPLAPAARRGLPTAEVGGSAGRRSEDASAGPGGRAIMFRHADELPGAGALRPGLPFILRVEEHGDWFVHPGNALLLGNATRGIADLPVLAAIGSRHATIQRITRERTVAYRLIPGRGCRVHRNRQGVGEEAPLHHGDVISLGGVLQFTFLQPVDGNGSAVLELSGDFTVKGCRRVILFQESGRSGSIVIGPGPSAHVPLRADLDRLELLRQDAGPSSGVLLVRSPLGVAVGDGAERPQSRVKPLTPVRAGRVRVFIDPV
jgi:hypothetical protein